MLAEGPVKADMARVTDHCGASSGGSVNAEDVSVGLPAIGPQGLQAIGTIAMISELSGDVLRTGAMWRVRAIPTAAIVTCQVRSSQRFA